MEKRIKIIKGDITKQATEAIVNAANSGLMGGGGVDGAIHRVGGPVILAECKEIIKKIGRLQTGKAAITTGGNLPAKYVIHTVGPIYKNIRGSASQKEMSRIAEKQRAELRSCYIESLKLAEEKGLKSIAFPSISTGAYGYPIEEAAPIAVAAVKNFLKEHPQVKEVIFVLFDDRTYQAYRSVL
jgi:O-acetyl-ADP-ribose deacetylase (regulator of RNase III)